MISLSEGASQPLLVDEMQLAFSPTGVLSASQHFEYRPQQQDLACAVARALAESHCLVAEAGTGVGKSLAYLLPSVRHAIDSGRKAVISTHTINLQEQLVRKDIPIVRKLLRQDFAAVLLKGRQNYLCPLRLRRAQEMAQDLFTSTEAEELAAIAAWAESTHDGTLSGLSFTPSPKIWQQICSDPQLCTARFCGPRGNCFFQEARKAAADALVVVVNHTLFFSLAAASLDMIDGDGPAPAGFLFANDFAILDEAHTIEHIAATQLGLHLSQKNLKHDLQRLYHPRTKKGLLKVYRRPSVLQAVENAIQQSDHFFAEMHQGIAFAGNTKEHRLRQPCTNPNTLAQPLRELWNEIDTLAGDVNDERARAELGDTARKLREVHGALQLFLDQSDEESVYWVERTGQDETQLELHAAPVQVAHRLRALLFREGNTCVLTSATLGVGDPSLQWFKKRVGAESAASLCIGSPFRYEEQMRIRIVEDMPEPSAKDYLKSMAVAIKEAVSETQGKAFVLFTSYRTMRDCAAHLQGFFKQKGWTLLVQGDGHTRHRLVEMFREDVNSILFGTDSFWTGVDVPGETLSNVIVTRLPFAVPDQPLTQAKSEFITAAGGDAFMELSLPDAILKLRQGVGRLIRNNTDRGVIHILDARILNKRYGKHFLQSLPPAPVEKLRLFPDARGR